MTKATARQSAGVDNETLKDRIVLLEQQIAAGRRAFDGIVEYKKRLEKEISGLRDQVGIMVEINGELANECGWKQCEAVEARLAILRKQITALRSENRTLRSAIPPKRKTARKTRK